MAISAHYQKKLWLILLIGLLLRLIAMWLIPLTDTTEARYGEIARKMIETHNWVTPLHEYNTELATCAPIACIALPEHNYGIPFWAKPPLSTWTAAASMKLLGVNEFAARLPSLLFSLGLIALLFQWLKPHPHNLNLIAICIVSTSLLFYGSAGLVMTDLALIFCSTLAMISFWMALTAPKRNLWGPVFFASLGLGLLAKGPLILVLVGLPTGLWTLVHGQLLKVWQRLPWITGLILALAIAGPWYYLAEQSTPGFLQYFIVGEHFSRFLISGWSGDHYGHAHSEALGTIWLYLIGGFLPWSALAAVALFKQRHSLSWRYPVADHWLSYLLLWTIMPVIFFTFAHNIIPPYALPAMPAGAILIAQLWVRAMQGPQPLEDQQSLKDPQHLKEPQPLKNPQQGARPLLWLSLVAPLVCAASIAAYVWAPERGKRSEKALVKVYSALRSHDTSQLHYFKERLYSAEFYTSGKVQVLNQSADIAALGSNGREDFVALNPRLTEPEVSQILHSNFKKVAELHQISLYQECPSSAACP